MRKVIKIGDKEYSMKASAYTQFKYKNDTGRSLLCDIQSLSDLQNLEDKEQVSKIDDLLEILLKLAFIMIQEADANQLSNYDDFLKNMDNLFDNNSWINEVIELAVSPISRGI